MTETGLTDSKMVAQVSFGKANPSTADGDAMNSGDWWKESTLPRKSRISLGFPSTGPDWSTPRKLSEPTLDADVARAAPDVVLGPRRGGGSSATTVWR